MRLGPFSRAALAASLVVAASACGDQCYIVPTWVDLVADTYYVRVPGDVAFTAETELGIDTCGPSPTEVVAYHWRLDGQALEPEDGGEPLGADISIHFDAPGTHVVQVRIEDDLGAELPVVGRASIFAY
jgi:hypothetical protein